MFRASRHIPAFRVAVVFLSIHSGLHAADCACAMPKVTFSADTSALAVRGENPPAPAPATIQIGASSSQSPFRDKAMEMEATYAVSVSLADEIDIDCTPKLDLVFPHCGIEYSTQGAAGPFVRGSMVEIRIVDQENGPQICEPSVVHVRLIRGPATDDANGHGKPGDRADARHSEPGYDFDVPTETPVFVPAGLGIEIPMGAAPAPDGYRSAGALVNYSPVQASSAAPSAWVHHAIPEVSAEISQHEVFNGGAVSERHYIVPDGVFRMRGWDSGTQSTAGLTGASETSIDVYDPASYDAGSHTFTGQPHSHYRLEAATGNGLEPGVRLVQSNHGVTSTQVFQTGGGGQLAQHANGDRVRQSTTVPPAQNQTSWQREITETTDGVTTSKVAETYQLAGGFYVMTESTVDPTPAAGDELATFRSWYSDGRLRSVSNPDGSWSFHEYGVGSNGPVTTSYRPWLSSTSLVLSNGTWSLPSSGLAIKNVTTADAYGTSNRSSLVNLSGGQIVAAMEDDSTSISTDEEEDFTLTTHTTRRSATSALNSYSLAHADDIADRFLAGRTIMTWDDTGRATLFEYERGTWSGSGFTPGGNGTDVRQFRSEGHIANPSTTSLPGNFTHVPSHSTKEVTITTALGVVRQESHVCDESGVYQMATAKDHEYESTGQRRHTGTKIGGVSVSKTQYVSPTITRRWGEDGSMTETETDAEGEIIRTATSGNAAVPAVTTIYSNIGLTSETMVNGRTVSSETRDAAGRILSSRDAIGTVVETDYASGGRIITRTGPDDVTTIETRHFEGQPLSTTGSGVIPVFHSYSVVSGLIAHTVTQGVDDGIRYRTTARNWDGSIAFETTPDPAGGENPITLEYGYADNSSALLRVHSLADNNTADRIQSNPADSAAAAMGHYSLSGMETDDNGPDIDDGDDRLTETSVSHVEINGVWQRQSITRSFHTADSSDAYSRTTLEALAPVAVNHDIYGAGLRWTSSTGNGTTTLTTHRDVFFSNATTVVSTDDSATVQSPDSQTVSQHGQTVSSSAYGTTHPETMAYDASGRLIRHTSATGAVTVHGYNAFGQLETTLDHAGKSTTYSYYPANHQSAGMLRKTTNPEGEVIENLYNERGQLVETTGDGTYRVTYEYNDYGERKFMRTYRTEQSDGDLTEWTYDPATGVLLEKTDAAGKATLYTYDSAGRLETREWSRLNTENLKLKTSYTYNAFGDLTATNYSDDTPDVTIAPDRLGRPSEITDASGTRTLTYHAVTGALDLIEYGSGGLLPSIELDYSWDAALRPAGYAVSGGGPSSTWEHDDQGRLETVSSGGATHTHAYLPGTNTLSSLTTDEGSSTVLTRTLYHDRMQRLIGIETKNGSGATLSRHGYTLDAAGRRTKATRENGQRWDYQYDTLGQVTSGVKKFPDQASIPGHTFGYSYDGIGNRTSAVQGGTGTALTGTGVTYAPNELNQYDTITTQGGRFILGEAPLAYPVTINGDVADRAGGLGFYWKQLSGDNSSGPLWNQDTVVSGGVTIQGYTWTPAASISPTHDFDGNLTSDGRWAYTWDAENRLTRMQTTTTAAANAGVPRQRLDFVYDSQSRRVSKTVSTSTDGDTWTFASHNRYLYDHWNLIAEYSAPSATSTSLTLEATHTWGLDLSGTMQGAGGVGGLLCTSINYQQSTINCFPSYDGNGNISAWISSSSTLLARMDYSPFGQLIAQYKFTNDAMLSRLRFGFSTRFTDAETGLLYYGYRFYDPVTGRWPSRDPIEESGGLQLYGFTGNNALNMQDLLGMVVVGDRKKMLDTIHQGSVGAHKAREEEYLRKIRSSNPNVTYPSVHGGRPFKPFSPRESGGMVCEKCTIKEDNSKEYTYRLTEKIGAWSPNSTPMVAINLAPRCEKNELLVGRWHTHPSELVSVVDDMRKPISKRTYKHYWSSGHSISDGDVIAHGKQSDGLPLYVTYREGVSYSPWSYSTDEYPPMGKTVRQSKEMEIEWLVFEGGKSR